MVTGYKVRYDNFVLETHACVLGLVSFDCHPGSPFLTSETHIVIARLCLLLPTPITLSLHQVTPVSTTTLTLSPQKVTRSICVLGCPLGLSRSPPPATHALRIAFNFSPQKAGTAAGRLSACATAKGASGR
jgi:hypothetical protein